MQEYRFYFGNQKEQVIKTACTPAIALFLLKCTNRNNWESYKLTDKKPVIKRKFNLLKRTV